MERIISFCGLFVMIGVAWLMSTHRRRVPWRIVGGGLALQFLFAGLVLRTVPGRAVFSWLDRLFLALLNAIEAGSLFVFGESYQDHSIAFKVLPTIIFFSAFMSLMYHFGIMQWLVALLARLMQVTLRTSGAETLSAAANIFVGQTEAPLVIRPYIAKMTLSELNAVMVGGFATIAGGVLAAYVAMGIPAQHLLSASVISAPAALLVAKVMLPETQQPQTLGTVKVVDQRETVNALDAITRGTLDGLKLALNVGAMLLVFLALIAAVNGLIQWFAGGLQERWGTNLNEFLGVDLHYEAWSLESLLGFVFAPFAWIMGIPADECLPAGQLLGLKTVTNEFVAYERMADMTGEKAFSERTQAILAYALCGFSNLGSIGIQLGGIGAIAPQRQADLARLGFRAMIGGTLAAFMTACVAGCLM